MSDIVTKGKISFQLASLCCSADSLSGSVSIRVFG